MLTHIANGWRVLKAGEIVANPVAWKRGQITVGYLVGFLSAGVVLVRGFGYELPITDEQLSAVATVILLVYGIFNNAVTVASTDKIDAIGRTVIQQVEDTGIRVTEQEGNTTEQLGRFPPTPDTKKVQDGIADSMARDSSLG